MLPSPEQKVDGVGGKKSTPASSGKAAASRLGLQELAEKITEASVLGTFHLNPGRDRGRTVVRMQGRQLPHPRIQSSAPRSTVSPHRTVGRPNSSSGHPAGWGRTVWSRKSPNTALGSAQHPPMAQGRDAL